MTERDKTFHDGPPLPRDASGKLILTPMPPLCSRPVSAQHPRDCTCKVDLDVDKIIVTSTVAIENPTTVTGAPRTKWTLDEGIAFARRLQTFLAPEGWHCALGGGTLHKGESKKDLDVIVYPHDSTKASKRRLRRALRAAGMLLWRRRERVVKHWRKAGSTDDKWVEIWMATRPRSVRPRRVDIMVLS